MNTSTPRMCHDPGNAGHRLDLGANRRPCLDINMHLKAGGLKLRSPLIKEQCDL